MKRYYSAVSPFYKRKRLRIGYRFWKAVVRLFFPKVEFIWKCDRPDDGEPVIFVCNHTKIYAPAAFLLRYDRPTRPWSNAHLLTLKEVGNHVYHNILSNRKPKFLLYPLATLLLPLIVWAFRSIEPIPVYKQTKRVVETFDKAIETLESGMQQIVFPEKLENPVNKYIFELQHGFTYLGKEYYEKTGKILKYYPVYAAQSLNKVLIGEPIAFDPQVHMSKQKIAICNYLENGIKELGDSLPEHKISVYE